MTPARSRARIATLCFVPFLVALEYSIVNVTLPGLAAELDVATADLQWVLSGYAVALGAGLLAGGRLADSVGLRRVLSIGLWGFAVTSVAAALAPTFGVLVVCRVGQGLSAAAAMPAALAAVTTLFEGRTRVRALSWWGAGASLGFAMGAVLGGVLSAAAGWRAVFVACTALAVAAVVLVGRVVPRIPPAVTEPPDWVGAVQIGVGAAAFIVACTGLAEVGTRPVAVLLWFGVAAAVVATVRVRRRRGTFTLVPAGFLSRRPILVANLVGAGAAAAGGGMVYFVTSFTQSALGWSPAASGLLLLPDAAAAAAGAQTAGALTARFGVARTSYLGMTAIAVGMSTLAVTPVGDGALGWLVVGTCLVGYGLVLVGVVASIQASGALGGGEHGLSGGLLVTTQQFGLAVGLALLSLAGVGGYRAATAAGAVLAVGVCVALRAFGGRRGAAVAGLTVPARRPRSGMVTSATAKHSDRTLDGG